jgi:hypothetical protein
MPAELKQSDFGKYLASLFHPAKEERPSNMWEIAERSRKLGGRLLEHKVGSN